MADPVVVNDPAQQTSLSTPPVAPTTSNQERVDRALDGYPPLTSAQPGLEPVVVAGEQTYPPLTPDQTVTEAAAPLPVDEPEDSVGTKAFKEVFRVNARWANRELQLIAEGHSPEALAIINP